MFFDQHRIEIKTPLMYLTKSETFALAEDVGILPVVIADSHTCYNGDREHQHEWGYGCGKCPACELRAKGYNEFVAMRAEQHGDTGFAQSIRDANQ